MKDINSDKDKIEKAISDPALFELAFKKYYSPLCKSSFRITRNKDASEDIVQDLFIKLWNNRNSLKIDESLKAYLYRAAINSSLNYLKQNKKLVNIESEDFHHFEPIIEHVAEDLELKETENKIKEAIDMLPAGCRTIFVLSRYEELSYGEIAESLNISIKTVENQMGKSLKILREHLKHLLTYLLLFLINL